ncbi:uncharacterized protein RSE6_01431 [Rhynchosporium secalis]|uniref:Uncharacterized protein n=1 Tax=Rhynchosporium secalis TaxID=38038 RepID=A0A1E1LXV0_RHYSE|nr:uncharacterized protein RSE6_01431 [Rhynchosporium secalis]
MATQLWPEILINVALAEADGPTNTGFDSHKSLRACCASIYTDIELEMRTDNFIYLVPVSFAISGRRRRIDLIYFADEKKYVIHAMTNAIATTKALNDIARAHHLAIAQLQGCFVSHARSGINDSSYFDIHPPIRTQSNTKSLISAHGIRCKPHNHITYYIKIKITLQLPTRPSAPVGTSHDPPIFTSPSTSPSTSPFLSHTHTHQPLEHTGYSALFAPRTFPHAQEVKNALY